MTIRPRPYTDDDLPQIQAALAGWIQTAGACGYCHVGDLPHRIYENLRGRHPIGELVQVWEDGTRIVGVAINFRFDTSFDVFASPACRGTDAEIGMLQLAYATTSRYVKAAGREDMAVITDVFDCDKIRADLLTQLGFAPYRLWDYITDRSLADPIANPHLPDEFTIRSATMDDYAQLAHVRSDAFNTTWSPEMYRDAVMRKPGYQPKREVVVIAPHGQIVAFTIIRLDEVNRVGLFEPVGTHPRFQRRGLARAMMLHALREMKDLGMETALVAHDANNTAALGLYRSLGFQKKYETLGYKRPI